MQMISILGVFRKAYMDIFLLYRHIFYFFISPLPNAEIFLENSDPDE